VTPRGQVWKWDFWGSGIFRKWVFGENDAARGQMFNRYMTPMGQVWKWAFWEVGFWENGFLGKMMPPGAKLSIDI
jgi:hypothetical protein